MTLFFYQYTVQCLLLCFSQSFRCFLLPYCTCCNIFLDDLFSLCLQCLLTCFPQRCAVTVIKEQCHKNLLPLVKLIPQCSDYYPKVAVKKIRICEMFLFEANSPVWPLPEDWPFSSSYRRFKAWMLLFLGRIIPPYSHFSQIAPLKPTYALKEYPNSAVWLLIVEGGGRGPSGMYHPSVGAIVEWAIAECLIT